MYLKYVKCRLDKIKSLIYFHVIYDIILSFIFRYKVKDAHALDFVVWISGNDYLNYTNLKISKLEYLVLCNIHEHNPHHMGGRF